MKKLLFTFLAALCCTVMAFANGIEINNIYYILDNENLTATVTYGGTNEAVPNGTSEYKGSITIPSTVSYNSKDYKVTSIGDYAFRNCDTRMGEPLISVTIPEGVTSIGTYAFYSCSSMTSVIIPSTITSIGDGAFTICESLTLMFQGDIPGSLADDLFYYFWFQVGRTPLPKVVVCDEYEDNYTYFSAKGHTIVSLSDFKAQVLMEITEAQENLGDITDQDFATIRSCLSAIESATTPGDVFTNKEIALLTIKLSPSKQDAIATLNDLVKNKVGLDIRRYITAINNATSEDQITEILNNAKEEISNSKTFTVGDKTYYLNNIGPDYTFYGDLIFNDKELYQSGNDFTVNGSITYSRTFKATGVWQAWFVPFDVKVSDMNDAGMEVAEIAGVLMDEKEPYIAFAKMTDPYAIVNANTPYVVKTTKSSVSMTLTGPDMCIRKSTSTELEAKRLTVQSSYNTFTFGGNYQQTNGYANEWYALNTSGIFQKMGDGANLAPQRFWMTIDTRTDTPYYTDESGAATTEFINFTVWGDDEPTGIETIDNGQWTIDNSQLYDLQGQKVTSIQKGQVYIMNGKKFFAK